MSAYGCAFLFSSEPLVAQFWLGTATGWVVQVSADNFPVKALIDYAPKVTDIC